MVYLPETGLALIQRQSPLPWIIDPVSGSSGQVGQEPEYYRPMTEEVVSTSRKWEEVAPELARIRKGKSETIDIRLITDSVIAMIYANNAGSTESRGEGAMELFNLTGQRLNEETIRFPFFRSGIVGTRHGILLRWGSLYETDRPFDANPGIVVYRFRP